MNRFVRLIQVGLPADKSEASKRIRSGNPDLLSIVKEGILILRIVICIRDICQGTFKSCSRR